MESRNSHQIPFLNEHLIEKLAGAKLPTKSEIFSHFWHHLKVLEKKPTIALHNCGKAVILCWEEAGLEPKLINNIVNDLSKWYLMHKVRDNHLLLSFLDTSLHLYTHAHACTHIDTHTHTEVYHTFLTFSRMHHQMMDQLTNRRTNRWTDRPMDRWTDGWTDTPSYRDARMHLKTLEC